MSRQTLASVLILCAIGIPALAENQGSPQGHYLFAWAGDVAKQGNDFLAVIDADPGSPAYGQLVTAVATDQKTMQVHHTEYTMPEGGFLFANDHVAGRTFIWDLRDPVNPKIVASFTDLDGYSHPHSFLRLPNGHVLASFQHLHHPGMDMPRVSMGSSGGIVEIDDQGRAIRSASTADPAYPDALLMAYSLVVLPEIDRVLVTNSSMHDEDPHGHSYQIFRLSYLKLLHTEYFDTGGRRYGEIDPEEPRRGPDGSVFVQTLACGIERVTRIGSAAPKSKLVFMFPGTFCGVPTIVGHYLIQSVPSYHGIVVLDIADSSNPVEVSRLKLDDVIRPHWTGWDPKTRRIVVTGYGDENRLFMLTFNESSGALAVDAAFHDQAGKPGFDFDDREWPHGWKGSAKPHGVVFSR